LKNLIGFDVFPSLDQEVKDHAMALPSPEHRTRPRGKPPAAGDGRGPEAQWGNDDVR